MPRKEAIQTKNNTFKLRIAYCLSYTCELDSRFELNLNRTIKSFFFLKDESFKWHNNSNLENSFFLAEKCFVSLVNFLCS